MSQALISCIVPVYNGERYLSEALGSILKQDYEPLELIVVDDGSTDGTKAIAQGYAARIRYFHQQNSGAPTARNLGIDKAEGEFLAFLDADDLWHPQKLSRQMARFKDRPELDLCIAHLQNFWIPDLQAKAEALAKHRFSQALPGYVTQSILARRSLFDSVGGFDPSLPVGDTTDWFLRVAEHGAVMELLPDVLLRRRIHHDNMSMANDEGRMSSMMEEKLLQVVKASLNRRRKTGDPCPRELQFPDSNWRKEK